MEVVVVRLLVVIVTIVLMECLSWCIHKYLFHGPLWFLHKSHHQKKESFFEWNDLFAVGFAVISLALMFADRHYFGNVFFVGLGISVYGVIYFIVHDWFVHRRLKTFSSSNSYLMAVRKAHKIHHKNRNKKQGKAFGLLFVNKKLLKAK